MLGDLLSWWLAQMRSLLPARLRAGGQPPDALLVTLPDPGASPGASPGGAEVGIARRRRGRETSLGRIDLASASPAGMAALRRGTRRILLRPPPGMLLEREVVLPAAAQRDPAGVLRYELDRLTPFAPEEVFWSWRRTGRDLSQGLSPGLSQGLRLRLALLPKAPLLGMIERLRQAGLPPGGIEVGDARGAVLALPLGAAAGPAEGRREAWRRRALLAAGIACGGLAVAAVALPFLLQSLALSAAERHIRALQPEVTEAEALRRRIAEAKGGQDAFAAERARVGDALRVLAMLTEILPDDTWLTELTLRQRRLTIAGRSAGAARLIGLLSADPTIRDTAFVAPVTRQEGGGADAFSIRAEIGM
jgi:general secretion pathway protein L